MKLYEFTFTDNLNLSETKILEYVENAMVQQAMEDNWAEGYTYKQSQAPELLPTGEKRYHFAVFGELLEDVGDGSAKQKSTSHSSADDVAAQPQSEI
jgi:hypothetical protein